MIGDDVNPLLHYLAAVGVDDVTISPPSLDDVFMAFYDQPDRETAIAGDALLLSGRR